MNDESASFEEARALVPEDPLSRRAFVKVGIGAAGVAYAAAVGYPVYRFIADPAVRSAEATAVTEVALDVAGLSPGSALMFRFGTRPALIIHHSDGTWVAFDAVCTHLGCTVQFQVDQDRIYCACPAGVYDARTGRNVSGPPPRPLPSYKVEVADGKAVVSRV